MNGTSEGYKAPATFLWLVLIGLVAVGLRLWMAAAFPFEQDELYTIIEATDLLGTTIQPGIQARPLYYFLLHPLLPYLPVVPFWQRLIPLLFGVAALPIVHALGHRFGGARGGIVALALLSVSPWHLYVSGMARYWSLVFLLSAAAMWMLLRAHESYTPRSLTLAALTLVAGVLTHPSFLVMWAPIFALLGLRLLIPGFRPPSKGTRVEILWFWLPLASGVTASVAFATIFSPDTGMGNWGGRGIGASLRLLPAIAQMMTPALGASALLGGLFLLRSDKSDSRLMGAMGLGALLGGPALLAVLSIRTNIYSDYAVAMLPLAIVMSAALLSHLTIFNRSGWWIGALLVVGASAPETASQLLNGMRFDPRAALKQAATTSPERIIVGWPLIILRHYAPGAQVMEQPSSPVALDSLASSRSPFWFIASRSRFGLMGPGGRSLEGWLNMNCSERGRWSDRRIDFRVYQTLLLQCTQPEDVASSRD